jgi:uncharacterized protein (DUF849 family)
LSEPFWGICVLQELIVNFTPTGMVPTKAMTPHVPVTPTEIIEEVHQAYELGITIAHLHARDENGAPTSDKAVYAKIFEGVRKHCKDLVVCLSLSGRKSPEFEKRSEPLDLLPDMGSLTLSSLNFAREASINSPEMIIKLAQKMLDLNIMPELEVFDLGMINGAKYLINKGLVKPPYYFNIIFGNVFGMQADLAEMGVAIKQLPDHSTWAFGGIGDAQLPATTAAIAMGGGVRIGLEDNIYFDLNRKELATNINLLKRVHDLASMFYRSVMTPAQFRVNHLSWYQMYGRKVVQGDSARISG